MKALVLVAAEQREFAGLEARLGRTRRLAWPVDYCRAAWLAGRRAVLLAHGMGGRRAAEALEAARDRIEIEAVISTGFCGGLDPALRPAEIFVADSVLGPEAKSYPAQPPFNRRPCARGLLVSADRIVADREEKRRLRELGARAVDMESAALAERAAAWGVPFLAIRAVTDTAEESFRLDLNRARRSDGQLGSVRLLAAALRRSGDGLRELWHLRKRARQAAQALGEYLANCRF